MTIVITLILVSLGGLSFLFRVAKGRALFVPQGPAIGLQAVDLDAFRNLVDPGEREFLRGSLAPAEFRSVHRERIRAALEYISCAARNAAILLRLGEAARRSPETSVAEAGERLVDTALRLRLYAFHAMAKLYLALLLPGPVVSSDVIAENYENMTRLVVLLGCLKQRTNGATAVL